MSILDGLLGGNSDNVQQSSSSNDFGSVVGTNPAFGASLDDVLHSSNTDDGGSSGGSGDSSEFTGLGSLDFGFQAPTVVGVSSSSEDSSASTTEGNNGGGILSGIA